MKRVAMTKYTTVLGMVLAFCTAGTAWAEKDGSRFYLPGDMTMAQAHKAIDAAVKQANAQDTLMNVAVVDAGGNLKAFARMDGAFLASIDISIRKARTARSLNMSTLQLAELAKPGGELYGIEVVDGGTMIFGGGELIVNRSGQVIGAIGVSGGSVAQDVAAAKAGVAALAAE